MLGSPSAKAFIATPTFAEAASVSDRSGSAAVMRAALARRRIRRQPVHRIRALQIRVDCADAQPNQPARETAHHVKLASAAK
jgi:hypothetical protein